MNNNNVIRYARVPIHCDATIQLGGELIPCRTLNVSLSGMALFCPVRRPIGRPLRVDFFLNRERSGAAGGRRMHGWISADAILVRHEPLDRGFLWGIQFHHLDYGVLESIAGYVDECLPPTSLAC